MGYHSTENPYNPDNKPSFEVSKREIYEELINQKSHTINLYEAIGGDSYNSVEEEE